MGGLSVIFLEPSSSQCKFPGCNSALCMQIVERYLSLVLLCGCILFCL